MSASRLSARKPFALTAFLLLLAAIPFAANATDAPQEVHGHSDAFAANGVAIAWGVRRGATDETTAIVLRVVADPARYTRLAVDGVDPFTRQRQVVVAERTVAGAFDVRMPRPHFADFPRTELRFYAVGEKPGAPASTNPGLVVFYLGVPDTTPEFANDPGLDAYLTDRIGGLARSGSKAP